MEHNHKEHKHNNDHDHKNKLNIKLLLSIILNLTITISEIIGGLVSNSLSLLSDAVHNLSDTVSIVLTYISIKIGSKQKTYKYTFGFKRIEILSALINAATLWVISVFLIIHAYERFITPQSINSKIMFIISIIGLLGNLFSVLMLHNHSQESMNIKSAYLHLLADTFSSIGVIFGSVLIYFYKIYWIDPLITVIIVFYILKESWDIIRDTLHILLQGAPTNINLKKIEELLKKIENVENIHHSHIWSLSEKEIFFESHINIKDMPVSNTAELTRQIKKLLYDNFGITHITLQYEVNGCPDYDIINNKEFTI
ncbi:MAG TPA: cation diffusion facilitator family transporter [bacterium]|nr:cation diffusion facilitator family transporter [bacterium]HOL47663.1 cation diffusion facilitator family transporter [bacterium]HPQ18420.1 cation diffusion facilitator family transporter [bacterium]